MLGVNQLEPVAIAHHEPDREVSGVKAHHFGRSGLVVMEVGDEVKAENMTVKRDGFFGIGNADRYVQEVFDRHRATPTLAVSYVAGRLAQGSLRRVTTWKLA